MISAASISTSIRRRAFTVVELMVAVTIMTLIILVLYGLFDQTQRALRGSITQVDVLEGGRAAMDILVQELEQARASGAEGTVNFFSTTEPPFYGNERTKDIRIDGQQRLSFSDNLPVDPLILPYTVGTDTSRTNILQEIYFLTQLGRQWSGTAYRVLAITNMTGAPTGIGTLARFQTNTMASFVTSNMFIVDYLQAYPTNFERIIDGVVHFKVTPVDKYGYTIQFPTNILTAPQVEAYGTNNLVMESEVPEAPHSTRTIFLNNAMPRYLDVELAVLEPQAVEQLRSIANADVLAQFWRNQISKIHIFRQRIPIRNAAQ